MNKKIGLKLILQISTLVILICIALTTITYMRVSSILTDNVKASLESDSVNTVKLFTKEFDKYKLQLELLGRNEEIKTMDWAIQEKVLKNESDKQGVSFQVSETSGFTRATNGATFDLSDKLNFKLTMETGNTIVTPPLVSSGDGELIIVITTPIRNDAGDITGVLGTVINALEFNKIVGEQKSSENGFTIMLDSKGQVVAHEDTQLIKDGVNHLEIYKNVQGYEKYVSVVEKMTKGEDDFAKINYDDESYYMAYYPLVDMNWSLGILVPESDFIQDANELRNIMIGLMFVFIIIGGVVAFVIAQRIKNPLQKIMVFAKELESGNMLYKLELNREDEIGQIGVSLNEMGDSIKELMVDVAESSESILNSTESFTTIISETTQAANEISKSAQEMATTNESQASDLLKGLSTVEELSKRIESVYESINDISGISSESAVYNKDGLNAVKNLVGKTDETTSQVKEVHDIVTTVDSSMDMISTITSTISVISDQTNLLALNAAIESARAGEAGKGFAVVADEIRKLAEQSSRSANEIQNLINEIQNQSKVAVKSINETEIVVGMQANAVEEVGNIFKTLSELISNQIEKIDETKELNESMNRGKDTILSMIENLSATAEQNAASTEEVYATTEQQSEGMSEVDDYANALKDLAINLKKDLDHFTIS